MTNGFTVSTINSCRMERNTKNSIYEYRLNKSCKVHDQKLIERGCVV